MNTSGEPDEKAAVVVPQSPPQEVREEIIGIIRNALAAYAAPPELGYKAREKQRAEYAAMAADAILAALSASPAAPSVGVEVREDDLLEDGFNGDNAHLVSCIKALIQLSDANALVPHRLGGHARALLSTAAFRLQAATPASGGDAPARDVAVMGHEMLREAVQWVLNIAALNYEQDEKLRSKGARTLKRIADRCAEVLALTSSGGDTVNLPAVARSEMIGAPCRDRKSCPPEASPAAPSVGVEVREALAQARKDIADIQRATIEGRVCDDVAWYDTITTLHDFCAQSLDNIDAALSTLRATPTTGEEG